MGNPPKDGDEFATRPSFDEGESRTPDEEKGKFFQSIDETPGHGKPTADEKSIGKGDRILGDFKIVREIGSGGMATVYEAEQISLRRMVALKILPSHLTFSDNAVEKFYREAEAGGRQSHPGIVSIYAVGVHEKTHFIAQELVEDGYSLSDRLSEFSDPVKLPKGYFREAAKIIAEAADALEHAHESGVVHRDVKPLNILLTPELHPKVTDFGLARVEDALALSQTGDFSGTPYYMSPEQAMSRRMGIDKRTDIYSLGVTLYESITLKRPFDGNSSHEVLKKVVLQEPKDPRRMNFRVPWDLSVICLKAMEKDPNHRYQSMAEFGNDLRRYLEGDVIHAQPTGAFNKIWKRLKRNSVVTGAVTVALAAVLFIIVSQVNIMRREKALEDESRKKSAAVGFLQTMLSSAHPDIDGMNVELLTVMDRMANVIDQSFGEQLEVEADLRTTFGGSYRSMGAYEKSEPQYREALAIRRDIAGDEDSKTLESVNALALLLIDMSKYDEATTLLDDALKIQMRLWGEDHPDTLKTMNNRALLLNNQGRFQEAKALHQRVLDCRMRILGDTHVDTVISMNNMGTMHSELGEYDEAEVYYRKVLELRSETRGKEYTESLLSMNNLATLLLKKQEFEESESLFNEALRIRIKLVGEAHPDTISTMNGLASLYAAKNDLAKAESMLKKVIGIERRVLGDEHKYTLSSLNNLGYVLIKQGKYAEGEEVFSEILPAQKRVFSGNHPTTIATMSNLAKSLFLQGKVDQAIAIWEDAIEMSRTGLPEGHLTRSSLGLNYGDGLVRKQRYDEAEKHLLSGYEGIKNVLGEQNAVTKQAAGLVVNLYEKWGKEEKVAQWRAMVRQEKPE